MTSNHTNPPVRGHATDHEERDIPYRILAKWTAVLLIGLVTVIALTYFIFGNPTRAVDSAHVLTRKMSQPVLQSDDAADMKRFREAERHHLTTYGWVDRAQGKIRIPIDQAMELLLQKGLPVRGSK